MLLYVCEWNTNGTNDLLVVDEENYIVDCLPEALFGVRVDWDLRRNEQLVAVDEMIEFLTNKHARQGGFQLVTTIPVESALRRVATSPVTDGSAAVAFIRRYFPDGE